MLLSVILKPQFIVGLGIFLFVLLLLGLLTGRRVIKVGVKWHRRLGYGIIAAAALHAAFMIYITFFL